MDNYSEKIKYRNKVIYINKNGLLHRLDGPAVEYNNGEKSWYIHGKYHRVNGPAIEYSNGYKEWWLYDEWVDENIHKIHSDSIFGVMYGY